MEDIAKRTEKETISMRIITVVALFFLPGTFVSVRFTAIALHNWMHSLTP
jgi:hypothetical protein